MNAAGRPLPGSPKPWATPPQRSVDAAALGRGATDEEVFAFARQSGAVMVTVNRSDFIDIAASHSHPGVLLIPSLPNKRLRPRSRPF